MQNPNNFWKNYEFLCFEVMYVDLEAEELASRNAAVATNDPLYAAIAKLTPQQKQIVMAFVAGLNANPNMPF